MSGTILKGENRTVTVRVRRTLEEGGAVIEPLEGGSGHQTVPGEKHVGVLRQHALAYATFEGEPWRSKVIKLEGHRIPGKKSATRSALFKLLQDGERRVLDLAKTLRLRESGVRRHLNELEEEGLVEPFFKRDGLGRPKKYYRLKSKKGGRAK
jgi:DNA-binding transcriptional ArsR family regulator